jgi:hypothetical protein
MSERPAALLWVRESAGHRGQAGEALETCRSTVHASPPYVRAACAARQSQPVLFQERIPLAYLGSLFFYALVLHFAP